ncbi:tyrosine-type recombinase/integrase [Brevundimonas diminuta]|uniref:tyrosine-type recombinase/integrase n=1 Tax=Brevundimonas diminuta TaxID=293 RepID=UPI003D059740
MIDRLQRGDAAIGLLQNVFDLHGMLPHCSAHGLRKAAARRLAEAGCTAHEIMSITGHQSLKEVERYTREVARRGLADTAMNRIARCTKPEHFRLTLSLRLDDS